MTFWKFRCLMLVFLCTSFTLLCFSSAVASRALWLHVDFWYCAMWNLKPHFWSTVLEQECERRTRALRGGNQKINWHLLKLIWKPENVLIYHLTFVGVTVQRGLCDIQGFTDSNQHCWNHFGKLRCWCAFFFLAFRIHRMGQLVKGFVCSLQWLKRCKI